MVPESEFDLRQAIIWSAFRISRGSSEARAHRGRWPARRTAHRARRARGRSPGDPVGAAVLSLIEGLEERDPCVRPMSYGEAGAILATALTGLTATTARR